MRYDYVMKVIQRIVTTIGPDGPENVQVYNGDNMTEALVAAGQCMVLSEDAMYRTISVTIQLSPEVHDA